MSKSLGQKLEQLGTKVKQLEGRVKRLQGNKNRIIELENDLDESEEWTVEQLKDLVEIINKQTDAGIEISDEFK